MVDVGLFLPQMRMSWPTIRDRARTAEAVGFGSVWLMDHLAPPGAAGHDTLEGWTTATAIAASTDVLRIGHLVLCDAFRHPAVLAKMAATLDVISDGRLELGIGWGSVPGELVAYGVSDESPAVRADRLRETLDVLALMFGGEPFDYDGKHVSLHGAVGLPTPVQAKVPIHIGGGGAQLTMPLVARYADWWNCPSYAVDRFDSLAPLRGNARISLQRPIGLAASSAMRAEVEAVAQRRLGPWGGLLVGTPEEIAATLRADVARGVELFILAFSDFGSDATLRLFADEVLPALEEGS